MEQKVTIAQSECEKFENVLSDNGIRYEVAMDDKHTRIILIDCNDRFFALTVHKGNPGAIEINGNIIRSNDAKNIINKFQTITGINLNICNTTKESERILETIERYR